MKLKLKAAHTTQCGSEKSFTFLRYTVLLDS